MYIFWPRPLKELIKRKCACCFAKDQDAAAASASREGRSRPEEGYDNLEYGEDAFKVESLSNLSDEASDRRGSNDEDEYLQAVRKKDGSEPLWIGAKQLQEDEMQPASELVRRSL